MNRNIYVDCTHTYYSLVNTGIQRVVRNIVSSIDTIENVDIIFIRLYHGQYYPFSQFPPKNTKRNLSHIKSILRKIYQLSNKIFGSIPYFNAFINSVQLRLYVNKLLNTLSIKNEQTPKEDAIVFNKDDILLLADATWSNCDYTLLEDAKQSGSILIPLIYDIIPITHPEYCQSDLSIAFEAWLKKSFHLFDYYIAISNTVKNETYSYLKNQLDKNLSIEKFDFFTLGSNFQKKDIEVHSINDVFKNIFNKKVFITVSTIEARKNHIYILKAFELLWKENIDVQYLIIGKIGWKTDAFIEKVLSHSEYNKRLFMQNDVSDHELEYAYKHAEALIFASFVEGFGLPIVESLYYNLNVLASDIPIHREVGKQNISYFDLDDPRNLAHIITSASYIQPIKEINFTTWKQSSKELISKILKLSQKS